MTHEIAYRVKVATLAPKHNVMEAVVHIGPMENDETTKTNARAYRLAVGATQICEPRSCQIAHDRLTIVNGSKLAQPCKNQET